MVFAEFKMIFQQFFKGPTKKTRLEYTTIENGFTSPNLATTITEETLQSYTTIQATNLQQPWLLSGKTTCFWSCRKDKELGPKKKKDKELF